MCGIFGVVAKENKYSQTELFKVFEKVGELSESRGSESSGLSIRDSSKSKYNILKSVLPISSLFRSEEYKKLKTEKSNNSNKIFAAIGHARLVTNGTQLEYCNNQPVVKDDIIGIHNGIIVNEKKIWEKYPELIRNYEIDTEIFLSLYRYFLKNSNSSISAGFKSLQEIYGTVASALFFNDREEAILTTNNGSLYFITNFSDLIIFASEKYTLQVLKNKKRILNKNFSINQIHPGDIYHINLSKFQITQFSNENINDEKDINTKLIKPFNLNEVAIKTDDKLKNKSTRLISYDSIINDVNLIKNKAVLEYNINEIELLKRCNKCVLPETFPFIKFDKNGICNICNNYKEKNLPSNSKDLIELITSHQSLGDNPDCLVPFSGGRDSSYTLHYLVNELKLKPVTFTYDWGMVTDLARRNIARICGKLGVENIIVSANIYKKRENIRKNVAAWLKKPSLGMIPLFMAGDKLFFYYFNKIMRQTNTKICFSGSNSLENTDFKVGFSNVDINFDKKAIDSMRGIDKIKLYKFILKNVLFNPSYLNSSVFDSLASFFSRYFLSRKNLIFFFGYVPWNEENIENTLINEYDWELSPESTSSWRIGDGTVGFYNYIYFTVAGFSEVDTFRSNQIREGMISRDRAMKLVYEENQPMYNSIKWYLDTIGLDYSRTIKTINKIDKLYSV